MNIENLTREQIDKIFGLVMDSKAQDELMRNCGEDYWMLGFVLDSELLNKLEKYSDKLFLEEKLTKKELEQKINKL